MNTTSLIHRPQRTTAGKTSKFADYAVVSFPQLKKHAIIKSSLINIDPLSPAGNQSGNIKAFGERKKLTVIKIGMFDFFSRRELENVEIYFSGTHQEMEEVSSRFSKDAGSEEIFIPENECEYPGVCDIRNQTTADDTNDDDDDYSSSTNRGRKQAQSITAIGRKQQTTTTAAATMDYLSQLSASGESNLSLLKITTVDILRCFVQNTLLNYIENKN